MIGGPCDGSGEPVTERFNGRCSQCDHVVGTALDRDKQEVVERHDAATGEAY